MKNNMNNKKYKLCCVSYMPFSYPEMPYRIYIARTNRGLVVGQHEVYSAETREDVERWAAEYCEDWVYCDSP
jgi:hypothetical protein